ncbi:Uu.00g065100.m01.CDS01 [Anthostomella pinea]|uniref:Uu.00g065100.m01.CDS01 n=1 Tax=Anthostomella pinea TaxID=933095 RepID=A0AAI8VUB0_9PEZI|nr:Uu.00g065100.m01.CDS01 [Anthostomella pinea]
MCPRETIFPLLSISNRRARIMKFTTLSLALISCASARVTLSQRDEAGEAQHPRIETRDVPSPRASGSSSTFKAAMRTRELHKRDRGFAPTDHLEFIYTDREQRFDPYGLEGTETTERAIVSGSAMYPTYFLERYQELSQVACYDNTIHLVFETDDAFRDAQLQTRDCANATVVTSHDGCQEEADARSYFKVEGVSYHPETRSVKFEAVEREIEDVFRNFTIGFDQTDEHHVRRSQAHGLERRQVPSVVDDVVGPRDLAPTVLGANTTHTANLDWYSNKTWDSPTLLYGQIWGGAYYGCNNCTQKGTLDMSHSDFKLHLGSLKNLTNGGKANPVSEGWVQISLKGYTLHMDTWIIGQGGLFKTFIPQALKHTFAKKWIPGIGEISLLWEPVIVITLTVELPVKLNFGFDLEIPDSTIRIDLSDADSGAQGFEGIKPKMLPTTANITHPELKFSQKLIVRTPITGMIGVKRTKEEGSNDHDSSHDGDRDELGNDLEEDDGYVLEPHGGFLVQTGPYMFLPLVDTVFYPGCPGLPSKNTSRSNSTSPNTSPSTNPSISPSTSPNTSPNTSLSTTISTSMNTSINTSLSTRADGTLVNYDGYVFQVNNRWSISGGWEVLAEARVPKIDPGFFTRFQHFGTTVTPLATCLSMHSGQPTWISVPKGVSTDGDGAAAIPKRTAGPTTETTPEPTPGPTPGPTPSGW